jgi:hypothetical protein
MIDWKRKQAGYIRESEGSIDAAGKKYKCSVLPGGNDSKQRNA